MAKDSVRINYIDNLRWITVSLLVLYHAAMAYNTWGEANYIFLSPEGTVASAVTFISPWFMGLMFLLAGISSRFSLGKRSPAAFIRERLLRLGIPLVFGIVFISSVLSYMADLTHNGYSGNYLSHFAVFFTKLTDLTGYDGGFTFAHLWFIVVLLVYSLILPIVIRAGSLIRGKGWKAVKTAGVTILALVSVAAFEIKFGGKPLIMYLCVFLLGYFLFSDTETVRRLARFKWALTAAFLIVSAADVILFHFVDGFDALNTVCCYLSFATGIPALIVLGHDHLNGTNAFAGFCSKISYVFYIVHFPVTVICQYFLAKAGAGLILNFFLTLLISYPVSFGICAAIEKTRYIRVLFGLRVKGRK